MRRLGWLERLDALELPNVRRNLVDRLRDAALFVGDHVHDIEGAHAARVLGVGVTTGGCDAAELRSAGAHVVLTSLADFPTWLETHLAA